MEDWKQRALQSLKNSLFPVPVELNELDWKSGLSPKTDRLAQHLSAFSNTTGGGIMVFGVNNDGSLSGIIKNDVDKIIQTLGNIARNNLNSPIQLNHCVVEYEGHSLLFIIIPEVIEKPVYLRGHDMFNAYMRSAGQTVKMTKRQVQVAISQSRGVPFEEMTALDGLTVDEILNCIFWEKLFEMQDKNIPKNKIYIIERLKEFNLIKKDKEAWSITNLGAILFAKDINLFSELKGRNVVVRCYSGTNNRELVSQQEGIYGYAYGFEGLINYIMQQLPVTEVINEVRKDMPAYPKIAIREFVANALIHQDFAISGMPITIEIFSNRMTITNPGAPLNDVNRLIDMPPRSRNELLAQAMFLLGVCERRGSGIDRAIEAIEKQKLPPVKFEKSETHTRVFLYPAKKLSEMNKNEKIRACYQHACLMYEDGKELNNQSLRERLGIDKNNSYVASRIIADTFSSGLIKYADPDTISRKYATYIPYYG